MVQKRGQFMKVSFEQFEKGLTDCFGIKYADHAREIYDNIVVPNKRGSVGSAGYDISSPIDFTLFAGETIKFPTGLRIQLEEGWWLACMPRSGLGMKYRLQLDNTIGVIDSDYFYSDNEGQLFFKITNDSKENKTLKVYAGDRFAQAIILPYAIVYDDMTVSKRNGGMGSTGLKL